MLKKNKYIEEILTAKILPFVLKPGRYVGNEHHIILKHPDEVTLRVALAFPEVYEMAMSYIGFDILYHVLNKEKDIWAERVYAPWTDMEAKMRENGLPLYSLESFTPLDQFHIIGFTLQYELTYTNVLNMLNLAGIPLWRRERGEEHPLIIAGGPCTCNPEPLSDFIDAFLIGDGEEAVVEMARYVMRARNQGQSRNRLLAGLSRIRGVYVPSLYKAVYNRQGWFSGIKRVNQQAPQRILTRIVPQLKAEYYPDKPIVPLLEITHDRLALEIMRGCTEGCRYCNAGMIYRPTRERSRRDILQQMHHGLSASGYSEVSFLSLSVSDYADLNNLMRESRKQLAGTEISVSFPSMRLDRFTEEIADFVATVRKSGFTFAPEAGSERLRRVINKNITEENLFHSVRIALENGWKRLKFYFMIGLPTETKEDVEAIAQLIEKVVRISKAYGRIQFNISVSPFSPKAHTPFQWERQNNREEFLEKIYLLKNRFAGLRRVKISWRDPDVSFIECVLGRSDRRIAPVIYDAWRAGAIFDGWSENFDIQRWIRAADRHHYDLHRFAAELNPQAPLPWDHIDKGITKNFLLRERKNAYAEITETDCKQGACYACGIQRKNAFRELTDCYTQPDLLKAQVVHTQAAVPVKSNKIRKPLPQQPDREIKRYRIQYEKKNYARYLSHLDLIRIFERVCRRAGIPLQYSQGFNPHPKMSFGPPLSLGFTSEAEYLDLELAAQFPAERLSGLINPLLPDGMKIVQLKEIKEKVTALSAAINSSEYLISLDSVSIPNQKFEQALTALLQEEHIEVQRRVKGKYKQINIRPFIETMRREKEYLFVKTCTIENRTVRIGELLNTLFAGQGVDGRALAVHRHRQLICQGAKENTPLEILL